MPEITSDDIENVVDDPEEETYTCDNCGNECDSVEMVEITAGSYPRRTTQMALCESCESDTVNCNDCGRVFIDDEHMRCIFNENICERCSENYSSCEDCGCDLHIGDCYHTDNCTYCSDCAPSDDEKDDRINDYSYKPSPRFFGTGKLFFGCELEVNYYEGKISEAVDWVLEALGEDHVYLKEDGSLTNGFEIVSHPHSYQESIALWGKMSKSAPMRSHDSGECGFHVHVTKSALTRMQIQKMVVFVNAPENAEFVDMIAQRTGNGYCAKKVAKIGHCGHSGSRYEAINLCNKNTVEFRIFRGNTQPERLLKNLEFVHALIHWVNTVSYRELTHGRFAEYVAKNKKTYANLQAFIERKREGNA